MAAEAPPLALRTRTLEVARIADAFGVVQRTAVEAAVGQAELRKGVSNVFRSLARRNQSLLQRQLRMLDAMERGTEDPDDLAQLFRLDHLTTRMRRQAEGLIILSGAPPGRGWREPVPVVEVLRGAIGEIEDYARVDLITSHRDLVPGAAVADVTHLLAELIENAALYSPPSTRVRVTAGPVASGFAVEIEDGGMGIPPETLAAHNERLANPPEFDLADSDQLGLLVVSLLAARHGIKVTLRGSPYGGISAVVLMPHPLALEADTASLPFAAAERVAAGRPDGDRGSAGAAGTDHRPGARLAASSIAPAMAGPKARLPARPEPPDKAAAPLVPRPPWDTVGSDSRPPAVAGVHHGLPRRVRQANLAPQLRDDPAAGGPGGAHNAGSAERARALIASIQRGWRNGRGDASRADASRADASRADASRAADGAAEPPWDTGPGPDYGGAER